MAVIATHIGTNIAATGPTLAVTVPVGGVPAGAIIVVCVCERPDATPGGSVTDTAGNSYAGAGAGASLNATQANGYGRVFYATNVIALNSGDTITWNKVGTDTCAMTAFYIVGAASIDSAATASSTGSSATPSVTSGTPGTANDFFVGVVAGQGSWVSFTQDSINGAWATPPNLATSGALSTRAKVAGGSLLVSGSIAQTYAPTLGASVFWAAFILAFTPKPIAAAQHYFNEAA